MKQQNYQHHSMYYAPHHFIFLPLMIILLGLGIRNTIVSDNSAQGWLLFAVQSFCVLYLAIMMRQHYALGNQDRIIRLEFRQRHFELLGKRSIEAEKQLSFSQIAAIRFCHDDEFEEMVHMAIAKKWSADEIKRSIKQWQPDNMRL